MGKLYCSLTFSKGSIHILQVLDKELLNLCDESVWFLSRETGNSSLIGWTQTIP